MLRSLIDILDRVCQPRRHRDLLVALWEQERWFDTPHQRDAAETARDALKDGGLWRLKPIPKPRWPSQCPGVWGRVRPPVLAADARHYGRREPPGATERPAASWASSPPLEAIRLAYLWRRNRQAKPRHEPRARFRRLRRGGHPGKEVSLAAEAEHHGCRGRQRRPIDGRAPGLDGLHREAL